MASCSVDAVEFNSLEDVKYCSAVHYVTCQWQRNVGLSQRFLQDPNENAEQQQQRHSCIRRMRAASNKCVHVRLLLIKIIKSLRLDYELHGYLWPALCSSEVNAILVSWSSVACSKYAHGLLHFVRYCGRKVTNRYRNPNTGRFGTAR